MRKLKLLAGVMILLLIFIVLPSMLVVVAGEPWYAWLMLLGIAAGAVVGIVVLFRVTAYAVDLIFSGGS